MADRQNLLIVHDAVGNFRGGAVVSEDAIAGGPAEVRRLVKIGAVRWVDRPVTEDAPAADAAVSLMSDDELSQRYRRLRDEHAARGDELRECVAELERERTRVRELEGLLEEATRPGPQFTASTTHTVGSDLSDDPDNAGAIVPPAPEGGPPPVVFGEARGPATHPAGGPGPHTDPLTYPDGEPIQAGAEALPAVPVVGEAVTTDVPAPDRSAEPGDDVPTVGGPGVAGGTRAARPGRGGRR